jgi:UDP-N-acetylmuramoylalanine--D-glutamate ligase
MELKNKKVVVMGLGLFGGGVGVTKYLVSQGAQVVVTDLRTPDKLQESLAQIEKLPVTLRLGEHRTEDFAAADLTLVNPAVPNNSPFLKLAAERHIPLDTEMNIFLREVKSPVIAITGSNGKSTTAAMIAHIWQNAGYKVWLGGNIGHSLLEDLPNIGQSDWVVIEISSFQLERTAWAKISPHIAVVTNLSPNHLDRHGTMQEYGAAKQNILRFQQKSDVAVLNACDAYVSRWGKYSAGRKIFFGKRGPHAVFIENESIIWRDKRKDIPVMLVSDVPLPGKAYQEDAMAAVAVAMRQGIAPATISAAMRTFQGLPHRLEFCGNGERRRLYNDSNATTPESTIAALEGVAGPIVLIAGGSSKKMGYAELGKVIARKVKVMLVMGETADEIVAEVNKCSNPLPQIVRVQNLEQAVERAYALSAPGDAVILSPASTSFGMFRNFAERGDIFKQLVQKYFHTNG